MSNTIKIKTDSNGTTVRAEFRAGRKVMDTTTLANEDKVAVWARHWAASNGTRREAIDIMCGDAVVMRKTEGRK